jgi:hypothetical protein
MTERTIYPTCPHCAHMLNADEMSCSGSDLWAIAPDEDSAVVECPICDKEYWVKGGYTPHYTSAFSEEELE